MKLALFASVAMLLLSSGATLGQQPVAVPTPKAPTQKQGEATAGIRAAIRSYAEAFERGDGKTLATLWTPDGERPVDTSRPGPSADADSAGAPAPSDASSD
jgi:hypothetical protein